LGLQDKFKINDFIVPLIFQDKLTVVDEFLKTSPKHHLEVVKLLDDILAHRNIPNEVDKIVL
jgi:hypothetical protein